MNWNLRDNFVSVVYMCESINNDILYKILNNVKIEFMVDFLFLRYASYFETFE